MKATNKMKQRPTVGTVSLGLELARTRKLALSLALALALGALVGLGPFGGLAGVAGAQCIDVDSPASPSFDDTGAWDPYGSVLGVAYQTFGTKECCVSNGGKPFWQMQRGFNDKEEAIANAPLLTGANRSAWCSEAIAYWHREAEHPFPGGYQCDWNAGWQLTNTTALRTWYQTAGSLPAEEGKGYWIGSGSFDHDDFRPGFNAPLPGSYQQLMGWDATDGWEGPLNAHSQLVDEVLVHRDAEGKIYRVDVKVIEGNAGGGEVTTSVIQDILRYTTAGSDLLPGGRKIRGWGVDLNTLYTPVMPIGDWSRLFYLDDPRYFRGVYDPPRPLPDPVGPLVAPWAEYAHLRATDPVRVSSPSRRFHGLDRGLPNPAERISWWIDGDRYARDDVQITIDLRGAYPIPVTGIGLDFACGAFPAEVRVATATSSGRFGRATVRTLPRAGDSRAADPTMQVDVSFGAARREARYVQITLPAAATHEDLVVEGFRLECDWGAEDSDRN